MGDILFTETPLFADTDTQNTSNDIVGGCIYAASLTSNRSLRTRSSRSGKACKPCTLDGGVDSTTAPRMACTKSPASCFDTPLVDNMRAALVPVGAAHWMLYHGIDRTLARENILKTIDAGLWRWPVCNMLQSLRQVHGELVRDANVRWHRNERRVCRGHRRVYFGRIIHERVESSVASREAFTMSTASVSSPTAFSDTLDRKTPNWDLFLFLSHRSAQSPLSAWNVDQRTGFANFRQEGSASSHWRHFEKHSPSKKANWSRTSVSDTQETSMRAASFCTSAASLAWEQTLQTRSCRLNKACNCWCRRWRILRRRHLGRPLFRRSGTSTVRHNDRLWSCSQTHREAELRLLQRTKKSWKIRVAKRRRCDNTGLLRNDRLCTHDSGVSP